MIFQSIPEDLAIILVILLGFVGAFLDSSLGMGYGLLGPILIILGFDYRIVVPILLISQMTTGISGVLFHMFYKNVDLTSRDTQDTKSSLLFIITGMIGMFFAVFIVASLPEEFVMLYISIMIICAGILMLPELKFHFSWKRMYALSILASFNKAISGGGYGPVMTIGQITSGRDAKESVAVTDLSEAFLSGLGFLLYVLYGAFDSNFLYLQESFPLIIKLGLIMIISGIIATPLGALITKKLEKNTAKKVIGSLSITIGITMIIRIILDFLSIWQIQV
ncbi:MAG: putative membrane transporter protein [Promethearchaeota archaeon]|nr:MAG: putative membrane transporter protein [Candidatus Lokiarchaeota archaeon]